VARPLGTAGRCASYGPDPMSDELGDNQATAVRTLADARGHAAPDDPQIRHVYGISGLLEVQGTATCRKPSELRRRIRHSWIRQCTSKQLSGPEPGGIR
jgi:hypothetical protein